jgi:hypothetical protein
MSIISSKSASRADRRASAIEIRTRSEPSRAPAAPLTLASWSVSRSAGLHIASSHSRQWTIAGPELELRATLIRTVIKPSITTLTRTVIKNDLEAIVQFTLSDPAAPGEAIIISESPAAQTFDAPGSLIGVVARDSRGTLLDVTFAPSSRAMRPIFARTELFTRLGIEGGRYEVA